MIPHSLKTVPALLGVVALVDLGILVTTRNPACLFLLLVALLITPAATIAARRPAL